MEITLRRRYPDRWDNDGSVALILGVDRVTVCVARNKGYVTFPVADRMACELNLHPAQVWGNAYWDALEDLNTRRQLSYERRDIKRKQRT